MKKYFLITIFTILLIFIANPVFANGAKEKNTTSEGVTLITEEEPKSQETKVEPEVVEAISDDVAIVNLIRQTSITKTQIDAALEIYASYGITEEVILESLIDDELIAQAIERDGYSEYITYYADAYIQQYRQFVESQVGTISDEDFEAICVQYNGMTSKQIGESYAKTYITQAYVQTVRPEAFQNAEMPTEEDIKLFYSQNIASFVKPENIKLAHVYFTFGENKEESLQKAQNISNLIAEGKLSFEDAVAGYSEDENSKEAFGEIGYLSLGDTDSINGMGQKFVTESFKLQAGEISDVIESNVGYHIVKVSEHNESEVIALDGILDEVEGITVHDYIAQYLEEALYESILNDEYNALAQSLRTEASIKYLNK